VVTKADSDREIIAEPAKDEMNGKEVNEIETWLLQLQYPTVNEGDFSSLTTKTQHLYLPPRLKVCESYSQSLQNSRTGVHCLEGRLRATSSDGGLLVARPNLQTLDRVG
jgi:hypothetical protein